MWFRHRPGTTPDDGILLPLPGGAPSRCAPTGTAFQLMQIYLRIRQRHSITSQPRRFVLSRQTDLMVSFISTLCREANAPAESPQGSNYTFATLSSKSRHN